MKKAGLTKAEKQATVKKWADWILRLRDEAKAAEASHGTQGPRAADREPLDGSRYRIGEYDAVL